MNPTFAAYRCEQTREIQKFPKVLADICVYSACVFMHGIPLIMLSSCVAGANVSSRCNTLFRSDIRFMNRCWKRTALLPARAHWGGLTCPSIILEKPRKEQFSLFFWRGGVTASFSVQDLCGGVSVVLRAVTTAARRQYLPAVTSRLSLGRQLLPLHPFLFHFWQVTVHRVGHGWSRATHATGLQEILRESLRRWQIYRGSDQRRRCPR